jgi:hypothetical protein
VLPLEPLLETDPRLIPHPDDFLARGRTLPKRIRVQALESSHVVFVTTGLAIGSGQVHDAVGAQVQSIEVTRGILDLLDDRVVNRPLCQCPSPA